MRSLKNDECLAPGNEMLPLRIGARHVRQERAVTAVLRVIEHRKMAGKRSAGSAAVVSDERGEAVMPYKRSDFGSVLNPK